MRASTRAMANKIAATTANMVVSLGGPAVCAGQAGPPIHARTGPDCSHVKRHQTEKSYLFPLDGAGWFARHVEYHPVDVGHLVGDPAGDASQHVVGHP